jgi:P4 family phage/plasmid primase-like protien
MTTAPQTDKHAAAWYARAKDLASWAWDHCVVRTDVWGGYVSLSDRAKKCKREDGTEFILGKTCTRPAKKYRGKLSLTVENLERHFRATQPAAVVGLHTSSADSRCKVGTVEIDAHGEQGNDPTVTIRAARAWYEKARALGFQPLLWDSDGKGGYHLDLILADLIPTARLFWFMREFVQDFGTHGLSVAPETFPKQPGVNPDPNGKGHYGNWCRIIGRHHTRPVWATVWDGTQWLPGADAVELVLRLAGNLPQLVPADAEAHGRVRAYLRKLPNRGEGQQRDDVAYNFLAFMVRDLSLSDPDALRYANEWDTGNRPPKGPARLAEILVNVHQYGKHAYGSGLASTRTTSNGHATTLPEAHPAAPPPPTEDANLTDVGNGLRFAAETATEARYVPGWGWLVWDGTRWARDRMGRVYELAKETVRRMYVAASERVNEIAAELRDADDDKEAKKELKQRTERAMAALAWALKSEDAKRIDALLKMARSDPRIVSPVEAFDADPFAFNVRNGTLDLRTAKLRPHDRADYITKLSPVEYDLAANAPTWDLLITGMWAGDFELIQWNQRWAGYAATGDVREQIIAILHGSGGNGKSVYAETLLDVFGDYGLKSNSELLLASKSDRHETEKAALAGRRLVVACETGEGRRLNEPLAKEASGGDRITARFMRQDHFTFSATFKLALSTNHRPAIHGTDVGIWRRVRLVPFLVRFWNPGETPGPEHLRADPMMREKLRRELPGVLNWIVAGAAEWFRDGLGTCKAVEAATAEYLSSEDIVGQFVDERCMRDVTAKEKAAALFAAYTAWAEARKERPMTQTTFGARLGDMGFDKDKSHGVKVYRGIGLRSGDSGDS